MKAFIWAIVAFVTVGILMPVATATAAPTAAQAALDEPRPRLLLLLDSSGSMAAPIGQGQTKISAAKTALRAVINELPATTDAGIRLFGSKVSKAGSPKACTDSQLVVKAKPDNKAALLKAVDKYKPFGETPIPYALQQAAKDLGKEGVRTIVLVSDGESSCAPSPCVTVKEIRKNYPGLTLNVLGLGVKGKARSQLECAAAAGGGSYFDANATDQLAAQLARVAKRSADPLRVEGTLTESGSEAYPKVLEAGEWQDVIGKFETPAGEKYYQFVHETPGTTFRVAAYTPGQPNEDGLILEVLDSRGEVCSTSEVERTEGTGLLAASVNMPLNCQVRGTYIVHVSRALGTKVVPLGIRIIEEPAKVNPGFNTPAASEEVEKTNVTGGSKKIAGSASLQNAPALGEGIYADQGVVGEPTFYRVPLQYGQSLRVKVKFPVAKGELARRLDSEGLETSLRLYNPMYGELALMNLGVNTGTAGLVPLELYNSTPRISSSLSNFMEADYSVAGDYYVSVDVAPRKGVFEIPYELTIDIEGDAQEGPAYAGDVTWTVEEGIKQPEEVPEELPTDEPTGVAPPAPTDPSDTVPVETAQAFQWRFFLWATISITLAACLYLYFWSARKQAALNRRRLEEDDED